MSVSTSRASSSTAGWYSPHPSGPGTQLGRAVVGDVGDGRVAVGHPVSDRPPSLVGDVPSPRRGTPPTANPPSAEGVGRQHIERPVPTQVPWADGEERGRHHSGQHALGVRPVFLRREPQGDLGVGMVAALEERQPLNVVPVQMGQEDCPVERLPVEKARPVGAPVPASSSRVGTVVPGAESSAVERERHAGGVTAVANELGPGAGVDPRVPQKWTRTRSVSRLVFAAVPFGELLKVRALQLIGLDHGHPAGGDGRQRRCAGTLLEMGSLPRRAPGPYSARRSPSCSTRITPSRTRKTSVPGSPLLGQDGAGGESLDP
jgi:hypothetical protein